MARLAAEAVVEIADDEDVADMEVILSVIFGDVSGDFEFDVERTLFGGLFHLFEAAAGKEADGGVFREVLMGALR